MQLINMYYIRISSCPKIETGRHNMKILQTILIIVCSIIITNGLKILSVFSYCAHSHYTLGYRLSKELADRGHEVTYVNCYPNQQQVKNLKEISVAAVKKPLTEWTAQLKDFGELSYLSQLEWIKNLGNFYTSKVFQTKGVKDLMNSNEEFDLVLLEHFVNDAMTIFHHRFKCPLVFLVPVPPATLNNYLVGNEAPPSFVPNLLTDFDPKMTFWQRLQNTYLYYAGELFVHFRLLPDQNSLLKEHFPDAPDLSTILYNASMVLSLSHPSLSDPVPLQPNTKPIAGYHVSPTKPLPKDIKKFLDEAEDGVVLFSMGSNLKSANFEPKKRKAILQAFSKIKQKVLWKFETDLPEKPNNVMIMDWLPQADVLAHPNVVAFISHGGLLGTIEAVHHGVPIFGIPVFWDQMKNIEDATRKGFAVRLDLKHLDEESFDKTLNEILDNPSYRKNAKERSKVMQDQPVHQLDEAVFWIEYVVRHNGAPHLKSVAATLPWYKRYSVDIIAFISLNIGVILLFIRFVVKLLKGGKPGNKLKKK